MTINDVDVEDVQLVSEDYIVEDANDTLRTDHEEIPESENISSRLISRPLVTDHLHRYKREHLYLSSNKHVRIKDENSSEIKQGAKKTKLKIKDMFRKVVALAMSQVSTAENMHKISLGKAQRDMDTRC